MNNEIENAYQEALDFVFSFIDFSLTRQFRNQPENFDLQRMVDFLEYLGNPQDDYHVIHVAGTKGKGSVSAFIESALRAAGYKTGFYTSPHLEEYTERIQVNRNPIPKKDFVEAVEAMKAHIDKVPHISAFELSTALAFWYFSRQNIDIAVVEVGMGGRLDATNVVNPLVSVITALSLDHIYILGDTLAKIAYEKGGIIKPGRPVVSSPQDEEARLVLERLCDERKSDFLRIGKDILFSPWAHSLIGQTFLLWHENEQALVNDFIETGGRDDWGPLRFSIPLLGYHQVENAATAYGALYTARQLGIQVSDEQIREGFSKVEWPGRFEVLRRYPPVIIDSAHNRDSARKLRLALDDYLPEQPIIMVFGASEDKDIDGMFSELLSRIHYVIATKSEHPRAADPELIVKKAQQFACKVEAVDLVEDAINRALDLAGNDSAILVTGSLFITGAVRNVWFNQIKINV